jgi:hypothetical protein
MAANSLAISASEFAAICDILYTYLHVYKISISIIARIVHLGNNTQKYFFALTICEISHRI